MFVYICYFYLQKYGKDNDKVLAGAQSEKKAVEDNEAALVRRFRFSFKIVPEGNSLYY